MINDKKWKGRKLRKRQRTKGRKIKERRGCKRKKNRKGKKTKGKNNNDKYEKNEWRESCGEIERKRGLRK